MKVGAFLSEVRVTQGGDRRPQLGTLYPVVLQDGHIHAKDGSRCEGTGMAELFEMVVL
jgi:hypothetical protein